MDLCVVVNSRWTLYSVTHQTHVTTGTRTIRAGQMCVQMVRFCLYLRVAQSLIVDLVQDDHSIGSRGFLPRDVHCTFCHHAFDRTCDVISFVCGKKQLHRFSIEMQNPCIVQGYDLYEHTWC